MYILGWCADYPDPQDWLSLVFHTDGIAAGRVGWSNKDFDALVEKADKLQIDDPERAKLYQQSQELLVGEEPVAFMYNDVTRFLVKPWVKGLKITPLDYFPGIFSLGTIEVVTQ